MFMLDGTDGVLEKHKGLDGEITMRKAWLLVVISFVLTSCSTMQAYAGNKRLEHEVATLKLETMFPLLGGLEIEMVDGKKLGFTENKVEMLPGKHDILLRAPYGPFFTIAFTAEAGQAYILRRKHSFFGPGYAYCEHYIENLSTGQIVASIIPSQTLLPLAVPRSPSD